MIRTCTSVLLATVLLSLLAACFRPPHRAVTGTPGAPTSEADHYRQHRARTAAHAGFTGVSDSYGHVDTISVDPDTASYDLAAAELRAGRFPAPHAIRVEEFVNAFGYGYAPPFEVEPVALDAALAPCPWAHDHLLLRVGVAAAPRPAQAGARHLVLAVDASGSMRHRERLALLRGAVDLLLEALSPQDRIALVVYRRDAELAVPPAAVSINRVAIANTLATLRAGGSTDGGDGLELAYRVAAEMDPTGAQVLCFTDGGFNTGRSSVPELVALARRHAAAGVHLTAIGVRSEDRDPFLNRLTRSADGSYLHLYEIDDARRHLVERLDAISGVAAADVKLQVFFNPDTVASWKLVGHRDRRLADVAFNDDRADAGELGHGQRVTALYQLVPRGVSAAGTVDPNPFIPGQQPDAQPNEHLVRVRLRARHPLAERSVLVERDLGPGDLARDADTAWAEVVARFALFLAEQLPADRRAWDRLVTDAHAARGEDPEGRRAGCIALMSRARDLRLDAVYAGR